MRTTIVTITGPSCSGKTTLEKELQHRHGFLRACSHTTRKPRMGEVENGDYYFVSKGTFKNMLRMDQFIEHTEFAGEFYGMSDKEINNLAMLGEPIVIVCDPEGLGQITARCATEGWHHVSVWISAPVEVLCERFILRLVGEIESKGINVRSAAKRMQNLMHNECDWMDLPENYPFSVIEETVEFSNLNSVIAKILMQTGRVKVLNAVAQSEKAA